jgi:hypothetical protein
MYTYVPARARNASIFSSLFRSRLPRTQSAAQMAHVALSRSLFLRVLANTKQSLSGEDVGRKIDAGARMSLGMSLCRRGLRVEWRWGRRGFGVSANLHGKPESRKALVSGMSKRHEEMCTHEPGKPILMPSHPRRSQRQERGRRGTSYT